MKKTSIYVDTSVIGGCCDPEFQEWSNGLLSDAYLRHRILTHKFHNDARHIAIATGAGADLLVSWNFKHIVRFDKIQKFNAVNIEMGYKPISIYSPREVTTYGRKSS